jgi:Holliday junction resolvase-like predicted endonuclease
VNIEREVIISLLKLTKDGPIARETVNRDARIPSTVSQKLLGKLQHDGLIYVRADCVEADSLQRLKLAVRAIESGSDFERVTGFLLWKEFEDIAALAFERNSYDVKRGLRFRHGGRKWEIDIVGCKKPIVVCVDCKHWHRGLHPSTLKRIVHEQVQRTFALVESLPNPAVKLECMSWDRHKFIPAVLSLTTGKFKFYDNVPIVPVFQLQDFLSNLPAYIDSLLVLTKNEEHALSHYGNSSG